MRILCAIVEPTADLVPLGSNTDLVHRRRICPKPIGDDAARPRNFFMIRLRSFSAAALSRFAAYEPSLKTLQKFSSVHAQVHNQFNQERHLVTRQVYKQRRSAALAEWCALAA